MARGPKRAPRRSAAQASTKRARTEPVREDDEEEYERANAAQEMAGDSDGDVAALQFLSRAELPDVAKAGAQAKAKERLVAEKRKQREELEAMRRPVVQSDSDVSTDMEGASESEDDSHDYEAQYLHQAARRERREAVKREMRAQQPLPIRTADGIVETVSDDELPALHSRAVYTDDDDMDDSSDESMEEPVPYTPSSAAHSRRFGLAPPYELACGALGTAVQRARALNEAREQIARLASQIVGDPEMGTAALQRLLVFAQAQVAPPPGDAGKAVQMHPHIRQLALLSLLAVWVDIIPGYRIRPLSEQEQKERVSQEVARRRDWEQSLVRLYRDYLECCEAEVRDTASPLSRVALRCFCTLLVRVPHFNYRKNLLASVVAHLSRKSWTSASEQCASALTQLLRQDADGELALELVQLLYRMIRERKLAVHANVLDVLVHLRLRSELSRDVKSGPMGAAPVARPRRVDPKQVRQGLAVQRSKKQVKRDRELQAIEREMREADAALDVELRERNQSETLKLVFALYFRILKSEVPLPLLASALEGLVHFAHHVSVDFFRDIVGVLRTRLADALQAHSYRAALLCMVTAFALQHGQGGALELDLGDMYGALYTVLLPLSTSGEVEEGEAPKRGSMAGLRRWSEASMLLHAMDLALVQAPRATLQVSLERTAAIVRRLLCAALHWPTTSTLRALQLAQAVLARTATIEARMDALLDNRDAVQDGQYDPYAAQPESARALASGEPCWELCLLSRTHANAQVRETALALMQWTR
ncbi:hypothetical protein MNAN1_002680 [Malassezia nana]|uniref:Nucleolar complex-associated protein 3 n=1 Tax=Malassezia nana TaxID=180528 RepID=A0AAF0EKY2_9BASI|nr:hypothetical protein MNAN1_002680 [Malassezia nana]